MKTKRFSTLLLLCLFLFPVCRGLSEASSTDDSTGPPILVGHVTLVEGQLLRYVPEEQDWAATVKDAPFGLEDTLYTTKNSRAEIILPNRTWIRIDGQTQIRLIAAQSDLTGVDVFTGTARFYHQGSQGIIKTFTPFGYVLAPAGAVFDLLVGEASLEVSALRGDLEFVQAGSLNKYRVKGGAPSLIAESGRVVTGKGAIDPRWRSWNAERDQVYARLQERSTESVRYLPPNLDYQAPVLEEHGRWERVSYQGDYYHFWRPIYVAADWGPFTAGRWTFWYDDPCWIPAEPFGYLTHHYGNWILVRGVWYWAPPVVRVKAHGHPLRLFPVPFAWYPGRVVWVHHNPFIGWVPLAPHEPYYGHRPWGPRVVMITAGQPGPLSITRYQYAGNAVVVPQTNFFTVTNYHPHKLGSIKRETILRDYRPVPVINPQVFTQYGALREKHRVTNAPLQEKPRAASLERIHLNQGRIQESERAKRLPTTLSAAPDPGTAPPKSEKFSGPGFSKPPGGTRDSRHSETLRREAPPPKGIKEPPPVEERPFRAPSEDHPKNGRVHPPGAKTRKVESPPAVEPQAESRRRNERFSPEPLIAPEAGGRKSPEEEPVSRKRHSGGDRERFEGESRFQGEEPRGRPAEDSGRSGRGKKDGK